MRNLRVVRAPDAEPSASDKHWNEVRRVDLKDKVERLRQGSVSIQDLGKLLSSIRTTLRHAHNPQYDFMSSFTSLEEINNLENKANVRFVRSGITSLKQSGYWPFLPDIAKAEVNQKVQKAVLKKVLSVLPLLPKGWTSLGITEGELRRCVELAPYLRKVHAVRMALFNVIGMSKLYPDITQSEMEKRVSLLDPATTPAMAPAIANELRYRVSQGEFTFSELYTTEAQLELTLKHLNKALSKLAP